MDMGVCWNSPEKTYNGCNHNCFSKEVEDGCHPCEGSILGVVGGTFLVHFMVTHVFLVGNGPFSPCSVLLSVKCA